MTSIRRHLLDLHFQFIFFKEIVSKILSGRMANPINYTRLAELTLKNEAVIRAGMAAIKIPENILINEVLNPSKARDLPMVSE